MLLRSSTLHAMNASSCFCVQSKHAEGNNGIGQIRSLHSRLVSRMLGLLRSKCTMRRECRKTRPLATPIAILQPCRHQFTLPVSIFCIRFPPSMYSVTSMVQSCRMTAPTNCTMLASRHDLRMAISRSKSSSATCLVSSLTCAGKGGKIRERLAK